MPESDRVISQIDKTFDASVERLCAFLRIPSVSADARHAEDMRGAANWLIESLRELDFETELCETDGHPVVLARHPGHDLGSSAGERRVLYYGHYDVQPPEPLDLWTSKPFEPALVTGPHGRRVVARGAVDDKGQLMTWLEALRAWHVLHGGPPVPVSVVIEGEEEVASEHLEPFLISRADELNADVCIVSDTAMPAVDRPAVTTMLRGIVYIEVTLHGPSHDLHSGMYGGAVVNPLNELSELLAGLHDLERRVTLDGFYDTVREPSKAEKDAWGKSRFEETAWLKAVGLKRSTGEQGRSLLERLWSRPTLDINGIWGGYTGEGAKTVIPSQASAKLSCRLVPDQDPDAVYDSLVEYFESNCPEGCRIEVKDFGRGAPVRTPLESPFVQAARRAAAGVFPHELALVGSGASIPIVAAMKRILGLDSLLLGFGLDDDRVHSPNEKFELRCFERGIKTHALLLRELAEG